MKKRIIIFLLMIFIILGIVGFINIYKKNHAIKNITTNELWKEYNNGKISIDEYVKDIIDISNEYSIDKFIFDNKDKLNKSTIKYYLEKINLSDVTFKFDEKENSISFSNFIVEPVYAKTKTSNLNKVVLSKNKNFLVWYSTTGKNATSEEKAIKIADGLEESIKKFNELLGKEYTFESRNLSKGIRYYDKRKILLKNNLDGDYLDNAMQVYLIEYDDDALARYVSRKTGSIFSKEVQELIGNDANGFIAQPYILIKPSAINDYEKLEQLYNHELFHHYQNEILCGHFECDLIKDEYISEATANWASSLITFKSTIEGYLNDWAGTSRKYSNKLLSDEMIKDYGATELSYALFVYLNNYSLYVPNGTNKILESIYKENSLKYLYDNATLDELAKVQENVSLKNLTQDYNNKNLIAAPSYGSIVPIKAQIIKKIPTDSYTYNSTLPPLAIDYYEITKSNLEAKIDKNNNIAAYLVSVNNNRYNIVDTVTSNSNLYTFDLSKYDKVYLMVANVSLITNDKYNLTIKTYERDNDKYISFEDCNANLDEELIKKIDTYYYDENNKVYKLTITLFFANGSDLTPWLREASRDIYTNVKIKGNKIQYDYAEETFNKLYSEQTISFFKDYHYGLACGNVIVKFNPNEL